MTQIRFDESAGYLEIQFQDAASVLDFKNLIQRGINLWPDASPTMKSIADIITIGTVQQNYYETPQLTPTPQPEDIALMTVYEPNKDDKLCKHCTYSVLAHISNKGVVLCPLFSNAKFFPKGDGRVSKIPG